jgi:hypothetical protein
VKILIKCTLFSQKHVVTLHLDNKKIFDEKVDETKNIYVAFES